MTGWALDLGTTNSGVARWDDAVALFPSNTIIRMVRTVPLLNTPELEADVQAFFEGYAAMDNTVAFIPGAPRGSPWSPPLQTGPTAWMTCLALRR